jgi:hypothetical protein
MKTVVLMPLTKLSLKRELIARLTSTILSSGRTLERCLNHGRKLFNHKKKVC